VAGWVESGFYETDREGLTGREGRPRLRNGRASSLKCVEVASPWTREPGPKDPRELPAKKPGRFFLQDPGELRLPHVGLAVEGHEALEGPEGEAPLQGDPARGESVDDPDQAVGREPSRREGGLQVPPEGGGVGRPRRARRRLLSEMDAGPAPGAGLPPSRLGPSSIPLGYPKHGRGKPARDGRMSDGPEPLGPAAELGPRLS